MQLVTAGRLSGPRPRLRAPPTDVADSAPSEPPCSPRTTVQMSKPPVTPSAMRMAISFASDPVTT